MSNPLSSTHHIDRILGNQHQIDNFLWDYCGLMGFFYAREMGSFPWTVLSVCEDSFFSHECDLSFLSLVFTLVVVQHMVAVGDILVTMDSRVVEDTHNQAVVDNLVAEDIPEVDSQAVVDSLVVDNPEVDNQAEVDSLAVVVGILDIISNHKA